MAPRDRRRWIHAAVVGLALVPALALVIQAPFGGLGANPVETLTHVTGEWGLRLLLMSLAITPLRRLTGVAALAPYRRSFGLLAFGYVLGHFMVYLALDLGFDLSFLAEDVLERPYITVGFAALCCLAPLAVTSTRSWQKRLGRNWVRLHWLVHPAIALALLHYLWGAKADLLPPLAHVALAAILLALRWRPRGSPGVSI